jgi:hypothetical protein
MMKKLSAFAAAALLGATQASALTLQLSIGQGAMINPRTSSINPKTNVAYVDSVSASPLTTEILVGYNINPWLTLDLGFVFAYDVFEPYYGVSDFRSYYVGFRPGIHAYFGTPPVGLRPYFRAAFPIQYDNATDRTFVGVLLGGGLEYKLGFLGIFGEVVVSPFFNHENLIPVEGRIGIALHF